MGEGTARGSWLGPSFHTHIRLPNSCLPPQAELGAFYPLFVLRPLETGRQDLPTLYTVLTSLKQVRNRVLVHGRSTG